MNYPRPTLLEWLGAACIFALLVVWIMAWAALCGR